MKTRIREKGQSLVIVVLCIVVLLGFVALATDVGVLFYTKRQLQSIADSAALGAASVLNCAALSGNGTVASGCPSVIMSGQISAQGGSTTGVSNANPATLGNVTLWVNNPPLYGPKAGNSSYVEVAACENSPIFFINLFAPTRKNCTGTTITGAMPVGARAVAFWGASHTCIAALGTSGTDISVTTSSSSATIDAPLCGISANSNLTLVSSGDPTPITAYSVGVAGTVSETGGTISPTPATGIVPVSDPLAFLPAPTAGTCSGSDTISSAGAKVTVPSGYCSITVSGAGDTITIPPGTYTGGINIGGASTTVTFSSGLYYIGSPGLSITCSSCTVQGTSDTFYLASGGVTMTASGTTFNLTAPTSGTYNGILFFQSRSDSTAANMTVSGTGSVFEGALYFSDAPLTFTASGSSESLYLAFVVQSLSITGASTAINDYATLYGTSPLGAATLTE